MVFTGPPEAESDLIKVIDSGMAKDLPRSFPVVIRTIDYLLALLETDPYSGFDIPPEAKRVVTFLSHPHPQDLSLPIAQDGAAILAVKGREVFTAYVPNECGPVFMTLIDRAFGKDVTTRTWDTVRKCSLA